MSKLFLGLRPLLALFLIGAAGAAARGGDLVELPAVQEYSFEHGYDVIELSDAGGRVVKTAPGPVKANISAYLDSDGERFFLSDWSHERFKQGKSFFWIRSRPAPSPQRAVPVPAAGAGSSAPSAGPGEEKMGAPPGSEPRPEPAHGAGETSIFGAISIRGYGESLAMAPDPALAAELVAGLKGLTEETPKLREIRTGRAGPDPAAILEELDTLRAAGVPVATPGQLAAALSSREALIDFFRAGGSRQGEAADFYGALVLVRGQAPSVVRIGDATGIDRFVGELRSFLMGNGESDALDRAGRDATVARLLGNGYDLVMKPLEREIRAHRRVTICGDGQLSLLPFELLRKTGVEWGGQTPVRSVGDLWEVRYLNAARDLLRSRSGAAAEEGRMAVLVGSPEYDLEIPADLSWEDRGESFRLDRAVSRHPAGVAGEIRLAPMPGGREEIESPNARLMAKGFTTLVLTGAEATEQNVRDRVRSPEILHLETQGLILAESVAEDPGRETALPSGARIRAGVALAGAQTTVDRWKAGETPVPAGDGILLDKELSKLDLGGTKLVVLSSWAPGEVIGEAEVVGLRAALMEAGARNLVLPLWPAPPWETSELMDRFYKELLKGQPVPAALADARGQVFRDIERREGLFEAARRAGAFIAVAAEPAGGPAGNKNASQD